MEPLWSSMQEAYEIKEKRPVKGIIARVTCVINSDVGDSEKDFAIIIAISTAQETKELSLTIREYKLLFQAMSKGQGV